MNFFNVLAAARLANADITHHLESDTVQIDGHRWDRWVALRNYPDSNCVPNSSNTYIRGMYA